MSTNQLPTFPAGTTSTSSEHSDSVLNENKLRAKSNRPRFGEANRGALVGAVVGAIGGLIAVGLAPAIAARNSGYFFATPVLSFMGWILGGIVGWLIGGQTGPRFESWLGVRNGNVVGGIIGGLVPV